MASDLPLSKDFYGNPPKIVDKPWGREEWLHFDGDYCYKRIILNAGNQTSFQYHKEKKETNYVLSGHAEVWLENDAGEIEKRVCGPGTFITVLPPKKHRVCALTDLVMLECSTPHVDDVVRIQDDTGRPDGRIQSEHNH
ncbi:MAG: hypothetical protein AABX53_02840 [Nanoarchaeota archaeon]